MTCPLELNFTVSVRSSFVHRKTSPSVCLQRQNTDYNVFCIQRLHFIVGQLLLSIGSENFFQSLPQYLTCIIFHMMDHRRQVLFCNHLIQRVCYFVCRRIPTYMLKALSHSGGASLLKVGGILER